ncbi:Uncharacterised protein [Vibrio cholerae]|nr:Uncharacterised protein [Vibrio cholerae]
MRRDSKKVAASQSIARFTARKPQNYSNKHL